MDISTTPKTIRKVGVVINELFQKSTFSKVNIRERWVRDQDFRTFPENLKGDFKIYFPKPLFLAGTVPTNLYIYIYIYIYI